MYIVVLLLGLAAAAVGIAAVGFGLSIKEFSLGNTLLVAGTTAFVGGLVMIAIGAAIRELRRIAEALANRPAPRFPRPGEPLDPYAPRAFRPPPATPRMPAMPPVPVPVPESAGEPVPGPTEPAAPSLQPQAETRAESPAVETESEAIPLSPEEPKRSSPFDTIWPPLDRADSRGDADKKMPSHEDDAETAESASPDAGVTESDAAGQVEEATPPDAGAPATPPEPPHAISILKSGVVDGMAYTLYSDGSIEAELPSGTIRFASISELRLHLEKTE